MDHMTTPIPLEFRGGFKDYWLASDVLESTSHAFDGFLFDTNGKKREYNEYRVDCITDFVIEYLELRSKEKPLFLFLLYLEPHHQNDHNAIEDPKGLKEIFSKYNIPGDLADLNGDWKEFFPDF
jgi:uncharacterized sulfatase